MQRRHLVLTVGAAALAGCGFELRRAPELPFATLAMLGFRPGSPLEQELRREIAASRSTRVVDNPQQAQLVLQVHRDVREKVVAASTAVGQVRELQLRVRLEFSLRKPDGDEVLPRTELLLKRDMNYSERDALGKEQEEELLYRAMQSDIVSRLMRRLAALHSL
jgi:LPS-assembly lipoprotein